MRTIEIKGLTIVLGDGVDVVIEGDVVRIAAKPAPERVEHHHHHYPAVAQPFQPYPALPIYHVPIYPDWTPPSPYWSITSFGPTTTGVNSGWTREEISS